MSTTSTTTSNKKRALPVHIVEQHHDVVPFIHRAIASKQLPFSGIPIIHFDSHPDLLISVHLDADDVFKPQKLYESISIENWLLPLTYGKHVDHVIWVKPPWANQIKASEQSFYVGKCKHTGKLRLSSKENYFLTDGLFCTPSNLENSTDCKLTVVELCPQTWSSLDPLYTKSIQKIELKPDSKSHEEQDENNSCINITPRSESGNKTDELFVNFNQWTEHLQDTVTTKPYILDIDLDFFSVKDPFKEIFEMEKGYLQCLFKCPPTTGNTDQEIEAYTLKRQKQLNSLESVFSALHTKWSNDEDDDVEDKTVPTVEELSQMTLTDLTGMTDDVINLFQDNEKAALRSLCENIFPRIQKQEVTFDQMFNFGCTLDDTELPHHVSDDAQINALVESTKMVLSQLPKPTIVTMSRSSYDDYCPLDQVNKIEAMVLKVINDTFGNLDISRNYDE